MCAVPVWNSAEPIQWIKNFSNDNTKLIRKHDLEILFSDIFFPDIIMCFTNPE